MKERGIIMSCESVRGIIAGVKQMTRRVVKPQPADMTTQVIMLSDGVRFATERDWVRCPYGVVGDRIWVKEGWSVPTTGIDCGTSYVGIQYKADDFEHEVIVPRDTWHQFTESINQDDWRSPLFMPRWASRLTLELTAVRVERLQKIGHRGCVAEGWPGSDEDRAEIEILGDGNDAAIEWYADLWDSINGKKHPWEGNPWVWVLEFKRIEEGN